LASVARLLRVLAASIFACMSLACHARIEVTAGGFSARLSDAETIPNRDFVLRWRAAKDTTRATLYMGRLPAGRARGRAVGRSK
jgi:hypothetical protein